jgi:hypothetical protein
MAGESIPEVPSVELHRREEHRDRARRHHVVDADAGPLDRPATALPERDLGLPLQEHHAGPRVQVCRGDGEGVEGSVRHAGLELIEGHAPLQELAERRGIEERLRPDVAESAAEGEIAHPGESDPPQ